MTSPSGLYTVHQSERADGYFALTVTCPRYTRLVRANWKPAPNGVGQTVMLGQAGTFDTAVYLPGNGPVALTIRCLRHFWATGTNLGTVTVVTNRVVSPLPENSGEGKRIVYSLSRQQVWAVEADGTVVHSHEVASRRHHTASGYLLTPGRYKVFSKSPLSLHATYGMRWWMGFARTYRSSIGFHAIPYNRRSRVPWHGSADLGQTRSNGCVRQADADAEFLYRWAPLGTPVFVVP